MKAKYRLPRHEVIQPTGNFRLIPLTKGQNAIVGVEDFEELSKFNWYARWEGATKSFYAARRKGHNVIVKMSRELLECAPGELVDHKNRDSLDNRRENLRKCTAFQNQCNHAAHSNNTSGYKGVSLDSRTKKWRAQIKVGYKPIQLGIYDKPEHAAIAYNVAAMLLHKEFAVLNSI